MTVVLIAIAVYAQPPRGANDLASLDLEQLMNIKVVSAARHEQRQMDSPRSASVITAAEMLRRNCRTVPEALTEMAGILVQHTNYGGGSPVIRGMIGNRILILVDGIRLNNAIYRLGPVQYLNTIDINTVERIEVIRGPGSVLYGSDALGGVIHIITKSHAGQEKGSSVRARTHTRASTADRSISGRLESGGYYGRLGFFGGITGKRFGDLRSGAGRQLHTGYDEWDGDVRLNLRTSPGGSLQAGLQRVTLEDVDRTDGLASGSELIYRWRPERRDMAFLQYRLEGLPRFVQAFQVNLNYQSQAEALERIARALPSQLIRNWDEVGTRGLTAQAESRLGSRQWLTYGTEIYLDQVISRRTDLPLGSAAVSPGPTTYADGARTRSAAVFLQDEIEATDSLSLSLGARYNSNRLQAELHEATAGRVDVDSTAGNLTASAYALYRLKPGLHLFGGVSEGFRAPNVDDVSVLAVFGGGTGFEVPNPALKPEHSHNYEAGVKYQGHRLSGTASWFISNYRDLIERQPGLRNGLPFLDANRNGVQDRGEPAIYLRQNVGQARVTGFHIEGEYELGERWRLFGHISATHGQDTRTHVPISRIPPVKGLVGVRWQPRWRLTVEGFGLGAAAQRRLSPGDLADRRIGPAGTAGFAIFGLRASFPAGPLGNVYCSFENLGDKRYRWHGSGIDAPGRSAVIGIEHVFE